MLPKPPDGYLPDDEAQRQLHVFVKGGKYDVVVLPKRAEPETVDKYVKEVLDNKDLGMQAVQRCGILMRFFDLRGRAEQFAKWLDRREADNKRFDRLLTAIALAGDLGDDKLQQQAGKLYPQIFAHKDAEPHFGALIDTFFHLPEGADPKCMTDVLDAKMKELEPKIETDQDAAVKYYAIEDYKRDRIPSVLNARKVREEALKMKTADRRHKEYARCYLGLVPTGYVDTRTWGMMMLQRECNDGQATDIAASLSQVLDIIASRGKAKGQMPPGDEKDLAIYATRCKRAIEFYGGQLTDKQAEFAAEHDHPEQPDVLYWEPSEKK